MSDAWMVDVDKDISKPVQTPQRTNPPPVPHLTAGPPPTVPMPMFMPGMPAPSTPSPINPFSTSGTGFTRIVPSGLAPMPALNPPGSYGLPPSSAAMAPTSTGPVLRPSPFYSPPPFFGPNVSVGHPSTAPRIQVGTPLPSVSMPPGGYGMSAGGRVHPSSFVPMPFNQPGGYGTPQSGRATAPPPTSVPPFSFAMGAPSSARTSPWGGSSAPVSSFPYPMPYGFALTATHPPSTTTTTTTTTGNNNAAPPVPSGPRRALAATLAAQLSLTPSTTGGEPSIAKVIISGRPPKTHKGSMGDHSTAWAVQVAGLQRQLVGVTVANAFIAVEKLCANLPTLTGHARSGLLAGLPKRRHDDATRGLATARNAAVASTASVAFTPGAALNVRLAILQNLIVAYLEAREAVPYSTINVRADSPAIAGMNKNESIAALLSLAGGGPHTPAQAFAVVRRHLDLGGIIRAALTADPQHLAEVAPALDPDQTAEQRLEPYIRQHVLSVCAMFPGLLTSGMDVDTGSASSTSTTSTSTSSTSTTSAPPTSATTTTTTSATAATTPEETLVALLLADAKRSLKEQANRLLAERLAERDEAITRNLKTARDRSREFAQLWTHFHGPTVPVPDPPAKPSRHRRQSVPKREWKPPPETPKRSNKRGRPDSSSGPRPAKRPRTNPGPAKPKSRTSRSGTLGVQLQLGADGTTITGVAVIGRPPPQHGGSHGAHTEAWGRKVQRIKTTLRGQQLNNVPTLLNPSATAAMDTGSSSATTATPVSDVALHEAQTIIADHLRAVDALPGSSYLAANTSGHGEGGALSVIAAYSAAVTNTNSSNPTPKPAPEEVFQAVCTLLDVGTLVEDGDEDGVADQVDDYIAGQDAAMLAYAGVDSETLFEAVWRGRDTDFEDSVEDDETDDPDDLDDLDDMDDVDDVDDLGDFDV